MSFRSSLAVVFAAVASLASSTLAGPLDPPAGPIESTHKTLTDVEPRRAISAASAPGDADSVYRISSPGSYYLAASFTAPAGKSAIEIAASNVTIDLNGFTVTSLATLDTIRLSVGGRSNITIRNGAIGFGLGGAIDIMPNIDGATLTVNSVIENVRITDAAGIGIRAGHLTTFTNVNIHGSQFGVFAGNKCRVVDCVVDECVGVGVWLGSGCSLSGCVMSNNGTQGLLAGNATTVTNCSFYSNEDKGCSLGDGAVVSNSTSYNNGDDGFALGDSSVINHCSARNNDGVGIGVAGGSEVTACASVSNGSHGLECTNRCMVRDCVALANGASTTSGAGIHVQGAGNRIEANHCASNDLGVDVDSTGNIVVRNTCSNNTTNWSITANNYHGTIVNRAGVATPSVNGDSASNAMGSTDPNANFTH